MKGFEQQALAALHDSLHHQKSEMWHEMNRSNKGEPFVLHHLLRNGVSTPSDLASALHATSGRISTLLGALEKKGYVNRRIDPKDRRNILVSLTDEGKCQAESEGNEISSVLKWIFSQMGERRTCEFVELVEEFMTYVSVCKPDGPWPDADTVAQAFERRAEQRKAAQAVGRFDAWSDVDAEEESSEAGARGRNSIETAVGEAL